MEEGSRMPAASPFYLWEMVDFKPSTSSLCCTVDWKCQRTDAARQRSPVAERSRKSSLGMVLGAPIPRLQNASQADVTYIIPLVSA